MLSLKCLQSVSERDIDMLLVEELESSVQFREWLASRVYGQPTYKNRIGAWHSVSDPNLGESDLIFLFVNELDGKAAVLIENKIDAPTQPDQGKRYRERGRMGQEAGMWDEFRTCVVAPEKYLKSSVHTEQYDAEISYEEIMAFFLSRRSVDNRFAYKALVVQEGIEQNRRGYQPKVHQGLTKFAEDYYEFCAERFSHLGMERTRPRPSQSIWVAFRPECLPKNSYIAHQTTAGFVKLFFSGSASHFEELKERYSPHLPNGAEVVPAGKSVAIAIEVPQIDDPWKKPFSDYKDAATQALTKVAEIIEAVKKSRSIAQGVEPDE